MIARNVRRRALTLSAAWCALALLASGASRAQANVIRVDVNGGGDYLTIQDGLHAASEGDTVVVEQGRYAGPSNVNLEFHGINKILRSKNGPRVTWIDCGSVSLCRGFYFHSGEDTTSVIEGFSIADAEIYNYSIGRGVLCDNASSPKFVNCEFLSNEANEGAAAYAFDGCRPVFVDCVSRANNDGACSGNDLVFRRCSFFDQICVTNSSAQGENLSFYHCVFEGNWSVERPGGGADCRESSMFRHCRFTSNGAPHGGAFHATGFVTAVSCTFDQNYAKWSGGAVSVSDGSLVVSDCQFHDSSVWDHEFEGRGGGLYCNNVHLSVTDCEFLGNSVRGRGGAIYMYDCSGTVSDCMIAENLGTIYDWIPRGGGALHPVAEPGSA
jgi:predicted outer membrane repeat protein